MLEIESKVRDFLVERCCVAPGEEIGVAVSGGADSVALLHILASVKRELNVCVVVLHYNHNIRGETSLRDKEFVHTVASEMGIDAVFGEGDVPSYARLKGLSLEEAARELRYGFFDRVRRERGLDRVALGHTKDDVVETFFINLLRGSSLDGLVSMKPVRGYFIRPILFLNKEEIISYLSAIGAEYVEDETNVDQRYLRNRIRYRLIPFLEEFNPNIRNLVFRTFSMLLNDSTYLERVAEDNMRSSVEFHGDWLSIDIGKLSKDMAVMTRVISMCLKRLLNSVYSLSYDNIMRIVELAMDGKGVVHLRGILKAHVESGFVIVETYDCKGSC